MLKNYKSVLKMKKLTILVLLLNVFFSYAQDNHLVKVLLDGKPAILNTKTGNTEYINSLKADNINISENNSDIIDSHIVKKGETLYAISNTYGVSVPHIKAINNIQTNTLSVGQVIKIGYAVSAKVKDNSFWTVAKGDTLYSISKQTGHSISKLKSINNLDSNLIVVGQKLFLN